MQDTNVSEALAASIFWVMTPRTDVIGYQRLGGIYCLHLLGYYTPRSDMVRYQLSEVFAASIFRVMTPCSNV